MENKIREFMCRDTANVERELFYHTVNNRSHRSSNKDLKKNLETIPGKYSLDSLQKSDILGTSNLTLQSET